MINRARFYGVPPWQYGALLFDIPLELLTTPAAMVLWTDWGGIMADAERQLSQPVEHTTETF